MASSASSTLAVFLMDLMQESSSSLAFDMGDDSSSGTTTGNQRQEGTAAGGCAGVVGSKITTLEIVADNAASSRLHGKSIVLSETKKKSRPCRWTASGETTTCSHLVVDRAMLVNAPLLLPSSTSGGHHRTSSSTRRRKHRHRRGSSCPTFSNHLISKISLPEKQDSSRPTSKGREDLVRRNSATAPRMPRRSSDCHPLKEAADSMFDDFVAGRCGPEKLLQGPSGRRNGKRRGHARGSSCPNFDDIAAADLSPGAMTATQVTLCTSLTSPNRGTRKVRATRSSSTRSSIATSAAVAKAPRMPTRSVDSYPPVLGGTRAKSEQEDATKQVVARSSSPTSTLQDIAAHDHNNDTSTSAKGTQLGVGLPPTLYRASSCPDNTTPRAPAMSPPSNHQRRTLTPMRYKKSSNSAWRRTSRQAASLPTPPLVVPSPRSA